jgi:hypothetical protein
VRLDSINLNGTDLPVQYTLKTFSEKGKGKRTAVMAGGCAALGEIIGGLAGGGKGAAIGSAPEAQLSLEIKKSPCPLSQPSASSYRNHSK